VSRGSVWLCVLSAIFVWAGCASKPPANVKAVDCAGPDIQWEIAPEAEITSFACAMGKQGMDPALIFSVELKNVSDRPLRFRANIFLVDADKAAGHLVPRKGNPPQVAPGGVESFKIPFIKTTEIPRKIEVLVVPLSE
jgi:hypothetical protein